MDKTLEREQTRDMEEIALREEYERDLVTIYRCIKALEEEKANRTKLYEAAYLDMIRRWGR